MWSDAGADQFLRTSLQSFNDFILASWQYLRMPAAQNYSDALNLNRMYDSAANYNPNGVPPKASLFGTPRYRAMATYIQATQLPAQHQIRMQEGNWPYLTNDVATFAAYYAAVANLQHPPLNVQAEKVPLRYLHVYPAQQAQANWRIGLNVKPDEMAAAMTALAPLLGQFPDIDHTKSSVPASTARLIPSSLSAAALDDMPPSETGVGAVAGLDLEPRVGRWEDPRRDWRSRRAPRRELYQLSLRHRLSGLLGAVATRRRTAVLQRLQDFPCRRHGPLRP